jgi:hypothetical protein
MATTTFVDGSTLTAAAWFNDVDTASYSYLTSVSGTNTITATGPKNLTYAAGLLVRFIPANDNSGATTINITPSGASALGAKNIYFSNAALIGGEVKQNKPMLLMYDGTQFQIVGNNAGQTTFASPTFTGAVNEQKRASIYQYTAWDPSDVAGSNTNAPATAAATSAATSYVTVANSSGTLTWTCVKDGVYRFTISGQNEYNNAITGANLNCDLGGTGTRYLGTNTAKIFSYVAGTLQPMCGTFVFYASMTAGQTVTTLPYFSVTSSGTTAQFTQQCTVACEYTGAN